MWYTEFYKSIRTKDLYLLYISKSQSLFFPKRIFETREDENWFRNEVFLKVKNR
ncbi:YcxB family protein [Flavobacterium pectinovorum]|uniref:YcxB family protein n=1 Tax=Flavobacterium pectinovorum TaxID=29533 RepID=A0A502E815_9FLAO|nr:YcxB family protein [Flavobacterium pectinovorum]